MKCRLKFPVPDDETAFLTFFETLESWTAEFFFADEKTCHVYVDREVAEPLRKFMDTLGFVVLSTDAGEDVDKELRDLRNEIDELVEGLELSSDRSEPVIDPP